MGKRNPNGNGTIRRRANGTWEGRYTIGWNPETGKQIQRSIYAPTKGEVRARLNKILQEIKDGTYTETNPITVGEWADMWLRDYLTNDKLYTKKSYTGIVRNHIKPMLEKIPLQKLDSKKVQQFINGLSNHKHKDKNLSAKTVKNIHGVLHAMLEQAKRLEYIQRNPADNTLLPRAMKPEVVPLQDTQVFTFLEMIHGHELEDLYIVDLFTGLRQSELLGLQWSDIDFEGREITVRRQLQFLGGEYGYVYATPKNGKKRIVPLPQIAFEALQRQMLRQEHQAKKLGSAWMNDDNLVFTDGLGRHLKHDYIYRQLKRVFAEMGVPSLRFHDLRHTYAVMGIIAGVDIKTLQENLGHHSSSFTLDTYGFVSKGMRQASANRLDEYINQAQKGSEKMMNQTPGKGTGKDAITKDNAFSR